MKQLTARTSTALVGFLMVVGLITIVTVSQASTTSAPPQGPVPLPATTAPQTPEINTDNATPPSPEPPVTVTETVDQSVVTVTEIVTPPPPPPVTTTEIASPPPVTTTAQAPVPNAVPTDAEIREEVSGAFGVVNTYWRNIFAGWEDPQGRPVYWMTPALYGGDGFYDSARGQDFQCGDEFLGSINAGFCGNVYSGTGTIAWDMDLWRDEERYGDGPIYSIVAHEVGHAAQMRFRHDGEGLATPTADPPEYEQQADCLAGATLSRAAQDGYLEIEPGDLDEIAASYMSLTEQDGGDHGDAADRLAEFRWGYNGNIESCLYNQGVPPH
jgi:hypothetical protein